MKSLIKKLSQGKLYWGLLLMVGLSFEAVALYYQYALDEWPCVLCIHTRIWISGMIVVSIIALLSKPGLWSTRFFHLLNTILTIGFVERSWQVLAVERGWTFSECNMESGLPSWFALDKWFPAVFEVKTSCGYTPLILFEISMAEIIMLASAGLMLVSLLLFISACLVTGDQE